MYLAIYQQYVRAFLSEQTNSAEFSILATVFCKVTEGGHFVTGLTVQAAGSEFSDYDVTNW